MKTKTTYYAIVYHGGKLLGCGSWGETKRYRHEAAAARAGELMAKKCRQCVGGSPIVRMYEVTVAVKAVTARWIEEDGQYAAAFRGEKWWSRDGYEWYDAVGLPVQSLAFSAATIQLVGGHRDGERIA